MVTSTGYFDFRVDEVAQLRLPFGIAAGDAHDIALVFVAQVLVLVDQCAAHAGGVLFIDAKDDGLLVAVAALLQEVGDLGCDQLGAVVDNQGAIEVLGVVEPVFHSSPSRSVLPGSGRYPSTSTSMWTLTTL